MLIYLFIAKIVYSMMDAKKRILLEDFFVTLHSILAQKEEVTEMQPVPDAHIPVLKFKFHGISIDLLYASLSLSVIPEVSVILLNI
jgi:poly(A) polymerase Pap1